MRYFITYDNTEIVQCDNYKIELKPDHCTLNNYNCISICKGIFKGASNLRKFETKDIDGFCVSKFKEISKLEAFKFICDSGVNF